MAYQDPIGERFYRRCCCSKRLVRAVVLLSELGYAIQDRPEVGQSWSASQRRQVKRAIKVVTRELTQVEKE